MLCSNGPVEIRICPNCWCYRSWSASRLLSLVRVKVEEVGGFENTQKSGYSTLIGSMLTSPRRKKAGKMRLQVQVPAKN